MNFNSGDGRAKMPLSPTIGSGNGSEIQLMESSLYPSTSSVSHSYSSNNIGQMQFDGAAANSFWSPHSHRGQMRLQSRRSQSREDLNSSLAETHLLNLKV